MEYRNAEFKCCKWIAGLRSGRSLAERLTSASGSAAAGAGAGGGGLQTRPNHAKRRRREENEVGALPILGQRSEEGQSATARSVKLAGAAAAGPAEPRPGSEESENK